MGQVLSPVSGDQGRHGRPSSSTDIVRFLNGEGQTRGGERHGEVLRLDDVDLERRHDFIQWLFPLDEPSAAVPGSPVLTKDDIAAIRASGAAQTALAAAAERMARFYDETEHWLVAHDHNHLRITRIIRALRLLAGEEAADAFRTRILARVALRQARISAVGREYWRRA